MKKTLKKSKKVNGNPKSPTKKGGRSYNHEKNNLRTSNTNNEDQNPAIIPPNQAAPEIIHNPQPFHFNIDQLRRMPRRERNLLGPGMLRSVSSRENSTAQDLYDLNTLVRYIAQVNEEEQRRGERTGGSGLKRNSSFKNLNNLKNPYNDNNNNKRTKSPPPTVLDYSLIKNHIQQYMNKYNISKEFAETLITLPKKRRDDMLTTMLLEKSKTRKGGKRGRKVKNKITKKRKNQKGGMITGKTVKWKGQHFNVYEVDKMVNGDIRRDQVIDVSPDTDDKLRILITDFNKNASKKSIIKILKEKLTPNTNYLYVIEYYKSKKPKGKAGVIMYFDDDFHFGDHATVAGDTDTNPDRHVLAAGEIINWIPKTATLICNNITGHYKIHHADAKKVINTFFNNSDKKTNITIDFRPFDDFDKECNCDKITQKRRQSGGTYEAKLQKLVDEYNLKLTPFLEESDKIKEKMKKIDENKKQIESHVHMSTKDLPKKTNDEIKDLEKRWNTLAENINNLKSVLTRKINELKK
jgi:hypothetical protein